MKSVDLACVGESFEDLVFAGLPRLPKLGEELRTKSFLRTYGGGTTITAVAASRLGVSTQIVSGLSDGAATRLAKENVRVTNLKKRGEEHAITAALSTAEDRAFATFDGVNLILAPRLIRALERVDARFVHLALCPRDIRPFVRSIQKLRQRGISVSIDCGYDLDLARDPLLLELLQSVNFVLINEAEATLYSRRNTLARAEAYWQEHVSNAIIKVGPQGSKWISARGVIEEAPPKVTPIDTTGAGDAFNAGFLAGLLSGLPPRRALRLGNVVGARSTRAIGGLDGLPRIEDL